MRFYWWDDAVAYANGLAAVDGKRCRVFRHEGAWCVTPSRERVSA